MTTDKMLEELIQKAEAGDADSQTGLALLYGTGFVVEKDLTTAEKWLLKAADLGSLDAMFWLGAYYAEFGKHRKAAKWYREAAKQGYAKAQHSLGTLYLDGEGVKQDYAQAAEWYRKAAAQGNLASQVNLGYLYNTGKGVEQDYAEAFYWFRKAADQGYALAQFNLALMYHKGDCVKQSYSKAIEWYRKAAEQGDVLSQYNLGLLHYEGFGPGEDEDIEEAYFWMFIAFENGDEDASICIEDFEDELNKEQKRKVRAKARKWLKDYKAKRANIISVPDHPIFKRFIQVIWEKEVSRGDR